MPMTDDQLRMRLEARDTIFFVGEDLSLHRIERQVESLGFGELFVVSATQGRQSSAPRIQVKPLSGGA